MTLMRLLLGALVLLKAVDLLRLAVVAPNLLVGGVLGGVWVAAGLAMFTRRWRYGALIVAADTALILTVTPEMYSNHLVLMGLVALFMGALDDRYAMVALRWQLSIVYLFTAVSKVTPWYLRGDRMPIVLQAALPDPAVAAIATLSVITELFLAVGLWFPRTRLFAILLGVALHGAIMATMVRTSFGGIRLGVFSGLMFLLYLAFLRLDPVWDRRFEQVVRRVDERAPAAMG